MGIGDWDQSPIPGFCYKKINYQKILIKLNILILIIVIIHGFPQINKKKLIKKQNLTFTNYFKNKTIVNNSLQNYKFKGVLNN